MGSLKNLRAFVPSTGAYISTPSRRLSTGTRVRKSAKVHTGERPTQMPELIPGYGDSRNLLR